MSDVGGQRISRSKQQTGQKLSQNVLSCFGIVSATKLGGLSSARHHTQYRVEEASSAIWTPK
jgi:hypothetical protein